MPGPEGIRPAAKPSSRDRRGVEAQRRPSVAGECRAMVNPMHRGQAAPGSLEEAGVGRRA